MHARAFVIQMRVDDMIKTPTPTLACPKIPLVVLDSILSKKAFFWHAFIQTDKLEQIYYLMRAKLLSNVMYLILIASD